MRSVTEVLLTSGDRGVVLVGAAGVGKTVIAQHVLHELSHQFEHIYLRGSASHSTTPYGALNVLLAELDEETASSPLLVLSALQRMFDVRSGRRRTLMHLEGVEDIDELSATVIAHLARVGAVRLLVTCEDLLRVPGEFFDLWKDGALERFDIAPLDLEATVDLLGRALDAPISRSAAQELWTVSGGNPKYLQLATKSYVASGYLFLQQDVWVSRDSPRAASGQSITDWTTTKLAALSPGARAAVEVLAVTGAMPVAVLLHALDADALDDLQCGGMMTLIPGGTPTVRLTYEVFADIVRSQLLSGRGRAALETLSALGADPAVPVRGRTALTLWSLDQGAQVPAAELLELARLANDLPIEGAARRLLDAIPQDALPADVASGVVIERTRYLVLAGQLDEACETLDALLQRDDAEDVPLAHWVKARFLAAALRARTHGREQEAPALLDAVVVRLDAEPESDDVRTLRGGLAVAQLQLHLHEGEVDAVRQGASMLLDTLPEDTGWNLRARGLLGLAEVTLGAQEQAVRMARTVDARLTGTSSVIDRDTAAAHRFGTLVLAGYWPEALEGMDRHDLETHSALFTGSLLEFAQGVLLSYLGRSGEALEKLLPAISQLRVRDRNGYLPLAEAAAAYACVLENEPEAAEDHLTAVRVDDQRRSWLLRETVSYFALLTQTWLDTADIVAEEFLARAVVLGDGGYHGLELYFLAPAVQIGRKDAVERLARAAAACEGPFARLCRDYAAGLSAGDPEMLKRASQQALKWGNYTLAGDIAAASIDHLTEGDDPMIRVHAEQILRKTSTPARRHVRRKVLSERERAIARLVAKGVANKEIAQQEHISPRTVEGHVHQIMSKLGLSSRKQLALVFGAQP